MTVLTGRPFKTLQAHQGGISEPHGSADENYGLLFAPGVAEAALRTTPGHLSLRARAPKAHLPAETDQRVSAD
ncbi:MAG: hypothetical protein GDA53_11550 [Rhodobacteraceae bacterium]|nr:hypothetical protein [Paracoccaceae bacterium]